MIGSVQRAVSLLRCFSGQEPELGVTELSRMLNVHKSTVSRLLTTLSAEGLVERDPRSGKYHLGMGLLEFAGLVVLHADMRQIARPILRRLSEITEETVNLAILDANESLNIEQAVSFSRRVSGFGWLGRKTPLHASSTGKILLAFAEARQGIQFSQLTLASFTENTITKPEILMQELNEIRVRGYATGLEELEIGLNAIAAPVRDHSGEVIAAISVTGPSPRLQVDRIHQEVAPQVMSYAQELSQALGYHGESKFNE